MRSWPEVGSATHPGFNVRDILGVSPGIRGFQGRKFGPFEGGKYITKR